MSYDDDVWIEDEKKYIKSKGQMKINLRIDQGLILWQMKDYKIFLYHYLNGNHSCYHIEMNSIEQIYTQIGSPNIIVILVSINPYIFLSNICNQETLAYYRINQDNIKKDQKQVPERMSLNLIYLKLHNYHSTNFLRFQYKKSGSGKQNQQKYFQIIQLQNQKVAYLEQFNKGKPLNSKYLLLILFQKHMNDRFGKFMHQYFNSDTKRVSTAIIDNYLLEKSRVVKINNQKGIITSFIKLKELISPQQFEYLKDGDLPYQRNEKSEIQETDLYIYLSNYCWIVKSQQCQIDYDSSKSKLVLDNSLKLASSLLGILIQDLEDLICKEIVIKNNNLESAQSSRDTLAKHVYEKLFNQLIEKINQLLLKTSNLQVFRIIATLVLQIHGWVFQIYLDSKYLLIPTNYIRIILINIILILQMKIRAAFQLSNVCCDRTGKKFLNFQVKIKKLDRKTELFMKQHFREFLNIRLIEFRLENFVKIKKQFRIYINISTIIQKLQVKLHNKLLKIKRAIRKLLFKKAIEKRIKLMRKINALVSQCTEVNQKLIKKVSLNQWKIKIHELIALREERLLGGVETINQQKQFFEIN
ncbi:unnamed protein product (macronuclear) [Paramecium tetraurelia]|uniref:Myosin motor domain-containing protein n=1 Tax=Paramecium tetraurelia TaxID=5888 RepID=A0DU68_PARTE|nr:uncharacterized protein GSPATT00020256001 [Paramecium tetraurelia]CAK86585.1 unnamed protein product [Paramecium tetraurelia]|eukprot:XP_001453982.1 hypothetical protein (macronuclear) [Paramecium tetraurelia strain d4-2]